METMKLKAEDELTAGQELKLYWPVLVISCLAYVLLQAANAFVPAVTMQATSSSLGMPVAMFASLNAIGAAIKSVCILFFMGPALDRFGPHKMINACLAGAAICNLLTAFSTGPLSFSTIFLLNYVFNSFAEQPAYICLYATYFHELLGVTTTAIASAYSFAGFLMPPLLSPLLVLFGWQAPWILVSVATALILPLSIAFVKPGPIAIKAKADTHHHANIFVDAMVVIFAKRLKHAEEEHKKEKVGFLNRRLSYFGSAVDPHLILHSLDKHHAIVGHDHDNHDHDADVTLEEALRMPKFWALVTAAFSFFLYGGALNLHLPSILSVDAGLSAVQSASVFSTYSGFAVGGKVLTGVFLSTPHLKRSVWLYLPFQLAYLLSHLLLFDLSPVALITGDIDAAVNITQNSVRLTAFSAMVGLGYGFCASLMQCLVKEFFGLAELAKIQPLIYGCVIVGCIGGMAIPGAIVEVFGSYRPFLLFSLCTTSLNFSMFVALFFLHPIGQPVGWLL